MFGLVFVFAFFVLMICLVFVGFYNCFYNCYTVLMFALLVANWPFCINKFDLIWRSDVDVGSVTRQACLCRQWRMLLSAATAASDIRRSLDDESVASAVFTHAFVATSVDYCNSLLAGAPKTTDKLQRVMNAAARVIINTRKFDRAVWRTSDAKIVIGRMSVTASNTDCESTSTNGYTAWHHGTCLIICTPVAEVPGRRHLSAGRGLIAI